MTEWLTEHPTAVGWLILAAVVLVGVAGDTYYKRFYKWPSS